MLAQDISSSALEDFSIIERVVSVFSLLGCIFIIATFCTLKSFHKPINRLVFYASIGNMMTNVATLMARSYIGMPSSAGCQLQAFLIQMFMPADAFWTLAMAVNVYLTFYHKYDAQNLRRMEIPYLLCCYGVPFIVALVFAFVSTSSQGRVYGNATIWCWVQQSWDIWRIATFYGPVWVVMVVTFFIYIRAGREIYRKHRQLQGLNYTSHYEPEPLQMNELPNMKTTEVSVTISDARDAIDLSLLGAGHVRHQSMSTQIMRPAAYSCSISATTSTGSTALNTTEAIPPHGPVPPKVRSGRKASIEANAAWSYTKCALLFFTAMLVTWIPSSANRLYSLAQKGEVSLTLEYMSAFVLPLQGFWNAVIYIVTSWKACQMLAEDAVALLKGESAASAGAASSSLKGGIRSWSRTGLRKEEGVLGVGRSRHVMQNGKDPETESMEELAQIRRPGTATP